MPDTLTPPEASAAPVPPAPAPPGSGGGFFQNLIDIYFARARRSRASCSGRASCCR